MREEQHLAEDVAPLVADGLGPRDAEGSGLDAVAAEREGPAADAAVVLAGVAAAAVVSRTMPARTGPCSP